MHRICDPERLCAGIPNGLDKLRQFIANLASTHAADKGEATWFALGVELVDQGKHVADLGGWPKLYTQWVTNPGEEVDVSTIELPGALPHPDEVSGCDIWQRGAGVNSC